LHTIEVATLATLAASVGLERWGDRGCLAGSGRTCLGGGLDSFAGRAELVQPDPARSRLPRVGVVLAAGQSQRLASVTGGGSKALLRLGGLSLVERAVRSLLAAGLERVLVVVGHDAGPVATVVGRLGRDRVR
jgi:hypothetical protein